MKKVLTIAGSDCSGGAGIQADIKTITAHKMYAMSVITALTAQNTTGVYEVVEIDPQFVSRQIDCVFDDIRPDAVKIGMVSNVKIIEAIADSLKRHNAKNIVLDPVMVATSGGKLITDNASKSLINELFPIADIITPNIPEAEALSGIQIKNSKDMLCAAVELTKITKAAVLIKGGHLNDCADDLLIYNERIVKFSAERINNSNTHGTGCTLSSAIACNLAAGKNIEESVNNAKKYITGALQAMLDLGKGSGPLDHTFCFEILTK